ncbi:hypothetical protein LF1_34810 [Rubripirellula obstinata]|uniref:Uncharacterized protein n=1 Tax=Rubripirellula obstinata TaxID=406547 RepID=A0A5B1CMD1_9BACT|nr:hypothetical protein [Rubripirellula obstinata]KAA1260939.1 hypothetical protein LF1_34810 [Rubripirellula obstinata]
MAYSRLIAPTGGFRVLQVPIDSQGGYTFTGEEKVSDTAKWGQGTITLAIIPVKNLRRALSPFCPYRWRRCP